MTIGNGEFECRKILPQNVDTIYQKNANANMDTIVLPKKSAKKHTCFFGTPYIKKHVTPSQLVSC